MLDPLPGIGLRIAGARDLGAAPDDAAGQAVGAAPARAGPRAGEHHVALIDVAGEDLFRVLRRSVEVDELDRRRDAGNRRGGGFAVGAGGNIAADMDRDLRLRHRLRPAGERDPAAGSNARVARQEADQRAADLQPLEHRRRAEADLPAERRIAGVEPPRRSASCARMPREMRDLPKGSCLPRRRAPAQRWLCGSTS